MNSRSVKSVRCYDLRSIAPAVALLAAAFSLLGCAGSSVALNPVAGTPASTPPTIATQPSNFTVPIGLNVTLSVTVDTGGGAVNEQWYRNGVAIPGASSVDYTTPIVAAIDTGTVYSFTISNSLGSATSKPATLTAGARAPKNGDLRFQQVDSENTVNGYKGIEQTYLNGAVPAFMDYPATGEPIMLAADQCDPNPTPIEYPCLWAIRMNYQPLGATAIAAGYFSGVYTNFEADLSTSHFQGTGGGGTGDGPVNAPNSVITTISLAPSNNVYALGYTTTSNVGGFDLAQHWIDLSQFQAAASQEGLNSRVITSLGFANGQLLYMAYGWTGDTTTQYDCLIVSTDFVNIGSAASSLAANGYIITAVGGDAINGLVLVGTRVRGDTLARPILIATGSDRVALQQQIPNEGYAVVSLTETRNGDITSVSEIGER